MPDRSPFLGALRNAVAEDVRRALAEGASPADRHRRLMERAKLLVCAYLWPESDDRGDAALLAGAEANVRALRGLQGPGGLFIGGDNVDSPPDSSFTVNDLCDTLQVIRTVDAAAGDGRLAALAAELDAVADAVEPALIAGGVHTPNHRWEISAALARLHRRRPSEALRRRAEEWLAEGVDITADGVYSERSANYAAWVSNPSLTAIAEVFGRKDAHAAVVHNLESTLGLIHPDDTVETVHSRRQDQLTRFPLGPYLVAYRRYAVQLGRRDFAWAAERALRDGVVHAPSTLAELLLEPALGDELPEATAPSAQGTWAQSRLVVDDNAQRRLVVFGGSDYPRFRRVRSGLSTNPTFLRLFAGEAVLDSVRLSRDFFGLGPFRADGLATDRDDGGPSHRLTETVAAHYYQPMPADLRSPSGEYELTDDGRFYGSMAFAQRARDEVALRTSVDVQPTDDGAILTLSVDGPDSPWALELAFREGGRFEGEGATPQENGSHLLTHGACVYRVGEDAIAVEAGDAYRSAGPGTYHPGEDYAFLGATDAADGSRLYLTGRSPARLVFSLRAERAVR